MHSTTAFAVIASPIGSSDLTPVDAFAVALIVVTGICATILVAHEGAHALAAELSGHRVAEVLLGTGPVLWTRRLAGVRITVRLFPLAGHTLTVPTDDTPWGRIIGAGPMMDLFIAALGLAIGGPVGVRLGAAAAFMFVANIIPWRSRGVHASDGRRLLDLRRQGPPDPLVLSSLRAFLEAQRSLETGDANAARAWVDHGLARSPGDLTLRVTEPFIAFAHHDPTLARERAGRLLIDPDLPDTIRPTIQNALAWASLLLDDPGLVPEALTASEAAIRARPGDRAIQGTRGWALIEAGQHAEGIALCRRSMRARIGRAGRDVTRCTLAIGLARQGRLNAAEQQLRAAGRREAGSELFVRARREVERAWALLPAEQVTDVVV